MLVLIAMRNLRASAINLIIGALILGGTFVFVVIGALLDSVNESMARSVIGSLAGHAQIYSSASKDELALYGAMGGDPDLKAVTDFPAIKAELEQLENVQQVVPMGASNALISSGNIVDLTLEKLRNLYKARDGQATELALKTLSRSEIDAAIVSETAHMRQIIKVLQGDAEKAMKDMLDEKSLDPETVSTLSTVAGDAFWSSFAQDPYNSLEFLENKVAPQVSDAQLMFLRYVGTDLDAFSQSFDRMQIIDGTQVPKSQRGFLIAKFFYEDQMKLKNARRLDKIDEALAAGRTIEKDDELKRFVRENASQTRDIVLQLDATATTVAISKLQTFLKSHEPDLATLLGQFFDTTDLNFKERYAFFYQALAPMLELYRVRIGDSLTIKAFSRSGYVHAVNVKVYGTFAFKGLEKSPLAGTTNLMDLMSFRDLFGYLTADRVKELQAIQRETGAKTVTRENAEADLFGGDSNVVADATASVIDTDHELSGESKKYRTQDLLNRVYTQTEIDDGVVLNAAVMLKDPSRTDETIERINALSTQKGWGIKAVGWQDAAGFLGKIIGVFRVLLTIGVVFIVLIAIIVIFGAMVMATIQRTQTIGTLRAIGAQRGFVLSMVLIESILLGVAFGGAGIVVSTIFMTMWHGVGIAAPNDVAYFFFSGPRLYPDYAPANLALAFGAVLAVTLLSTVIPALMASRISPLRAMQSDE